MTQIWGAAGADDDLNLLAERVENALKDDAVPAGRRAFFEALALLQRAQLGQALPKFRRAARVCQPPFDTLAKLAAAECERALGRHALASRQWQRLGADEAAPPDARRLAWLSARALAEARGDDAILRRAERALEELR